MAAGFAVSLRHPGLGARCVSPAFATAGHDRHAGAASDHRPGGLGVPLAIGMALGLSFGWVLGLVLAASAAAFGAGEVS